MKKNKCPYFEWCPHITAMCRIYLPDESCPLYLNLKKIIEEKEKNNVI